MPMEEIYKRLIELDLIELLLNALNSVYSGAASGGGGARGQPSTFSILYIRYRKSAVWRASIEEKLQKSGNHRPGRHLI